MKVKTWETVLVFVILGIVLTISSTYVFNIVEKANKSGVENQTRAMAATVEQMYIESIMEGKDELPFIAEFVNSEMYLKTGDPSRTYIYNGKVKTSGNFPKSGTIKILSNETVIINELVIRNYICNKEPNRDLICEKA